MQDVKREVEAARRAVKEVHTKKALNATAVSAAEEKAASVKRRLPKLEASKGAAAAAKVGLLHLTLKTAKLSLLPKDAIRKPLHLPLLADFTRKRSRELYTMAYSLHLSCIGSADLT